MKKTDKTIIQALRNNGRVRLTELSRKTGLPVSTLHERLKKYMKQDILQPKALLHFHKLGYTGSAHILLAASKEDKDSLFSHLKAHPNINSLYKINNGWHLLMECIFPDMYQLESFIEHLEHQYTITRKEIHYILDELKREAFYTEQPLAEATFK